MSKQGNLTIKRKNLEREREKRESGGGKRKCIFMQKKHLLFKMSAGTNSRGNDRYRDTLRHNIAHSCVAS